VLQRLHQRWETNRCSNFTTPWSTVWEGTKGAKSIIYATYKRECEAHFSVMHQLEVMRQYVKKHLQELREKNQDEVLIMKQHMFHFTTWLKDLNLLFWQNRRRKDISFVDF
jgi:hypothetical protein